MARHLGRNLQGVRWFLEQDQDPNRIKSQAKEKGSLIMLPSRFLYLR